MSTIIARLTLVDYNGIEHVINKELDCEMTIDELDKWAHYKTTRQGKTLINLSIETVDPL
jgi:hypothetical protein